MLHSIKLHDPSRYGNSEFLLKVCRFDVFSSRPLNTYTVLINVQILLKFVIIDYSSFFNLRSILSNKVSLRNEETARDSLRSRQILFLFYLLPIIWIDKRLRQDITCLKDSYVCGCFWLGDELFISIIGHSMSFWDKALYLQTFFCPLVAKI